SQGKENRYRYLPACLGSGSADNPRSFRGDAFPCAGDTGQVSPTPADGQCRSAAEAGQDSRRRYAAHRPKGTGGNEGKRKRRERLQRPGKGMERPAAAERGGGAFAA